MGFLCACLVVGFAPVNVTPSVNTSPHLTSSLTPTPHPTHPLPHSYTSPHPTPPSLLHPTLPHSTRPHSIPPSLYCTLQGTVDSMVLSDGGKGENNDPESEAVNIFARMIIDESPDPAPLTYFSRCVHKSYRTDYMY